MTTQHAGWARMWANIAARYGDAACHNADTNETWQYMGTYNGVHQFRHRSLPSAEGRRVYCNIEALPGDDRVIATKAAEAVAS